MKLQMMTAMFIMIVNHVVSDIDFGLLFNFELYRLLPIGQALSVFIMLGVTCFLSLVKVRIKIYKIDYHMKVVHLLYSMSVVLMMLL